MKGWSGAIIAVAVALAMIPLGIAASVLFSALSAGVRQEGKTDRTDARQDGQTNRVDTRQDNQTERVELRNAPQLTRAEGNASAKDTRAEAAALSRKARDCRKGCKGDTDCFNRCYNGTT